MCIAGGGRLVTTWKSDCCAGQCIDSRVCIDGTAQVPSRHHAMMTLDLISTVQQTAVPVPVDLDVHLDGSSSGSSGSSSTSRTPLSDFAASLNQYFNLPLLVVDQRFEAFFQNLVHLYSFRNHVLAHIQSAVRDRVNHFLEVTLHIRRDAEVLSLLENKIIWPQGTSFFPDSNIDMGLQAAKHAGQHAVMSRAAFAHRTYSSCF